MLQEVIVETAGEVSVETSPAYLTKATSKMNPIANRKYALRIDGITYLATGAIDLKPIDGFITFLDFRRFHEPERKVLPPCDINKTVVYVNVNKIEMFAELP